MTKPGNRVMLLVCVASVISFSLSHLHFLSRGLQGVVSGEQFASSELNQDVVIDVGDPFDKNTTTPLFFHVPKAGGTTVQDFTARCLGLVVASEVGVTYGHANDRTIHTFTLEDDDSTFVNIDPTLPEGLERAKKMGFAKSGLADVVFTGFIPQATNTIFDDDHRASTFAIFRHPFSKAISQFYYLQKATHEPTYHKEWENMTFTEYLRAGRHIEHDWMVRNILGKYTEKLDDDDLEKAKAFVSDKMWVGLLTEMKYSMQRFGAIYGWDEHPKWDSCLERFSTHGSNKHKHPEVDPKSKAWKLLQEINRYDTQLFVHVVAVFEEQRQYFVEEEPLVQANKLLE